LVPPPRWETLETIAEWFSIRNERISSKPLSIQLIGQAAFQFSRCESGFWDCSQPVHPNRAAAAAYQLLEEMPLLNNTVSHSGPGFDGSQ
jgi:hypothetical protein